MNTFAALCLFDLQDGGVGLHDGHDYLVDVVLEAVVDLLLFVYGLHQLKPDKQKCIKETEKTEIWS